MFADDLAKQLSRELELDPPLAPNEEGEYGFMLGDRLMIALKPHESGMALSTVVGNYPADDSPDQEKLFRHLLEANLLGQGTGRGCLSITPTEREVRLTLSLPIEVPYSEWREYLEEFLNFAEYWRTELATYPPSSPNA